MATKRTRPELKQYFVRNAIPSQEEFAALIDGMVNQEDDGLRKESTSDPLVIHADDTNQKRAIGLHFEDAERDWVIGLNPYAEPERPETATRGFGIADKDGRTRLFIDHATGHVGIGTLTPGRPLTVATTFQVGAASNPINFTQRWSGTPDNATNVAEISNDTDDFKALKIVGNRSAGEPGPSFGRKVSVFDILSVHGDLVVTDQGTFGLKTPKAVVEDTLTIEGKVEFGGGARQKVHLNGSGYGIGDQANTFYFRTPRNFAWFIGGEHRDGELDAGGGAVEMTYGPGRFSILGGSNTIQFKNNRTELPASQPNVAEIANDTGSEQALVITGNRSRGLNEPGTGRRVQVRDILDVQGDLSVSRNVKVTGELETTRIKVSEGLDLSNTQIDRLELQHLEVKQDATVEGQLRVTGGYEVQQLTVNDTLDAQQDVQVGGQLTVTGDSQVQQLTVNQQLNLNGGLQVQQLQINDLTVDSQLTTENLSVNGQLNISGQNELQANHIRASRATIDGECEVDQLTVRQEFEMNQFKVQMLEIGESSSNQHATLIYNSGTSGLRIRGGVVEMWDSLYVHGTLDADDTSNLSDRRLKKNIERIPGGLDAIRKLRPVSFEWLDPDRTGRSLGLIGQEVAEILPEVASPTRGEMFGIRYSGLVAVLIRAVQELDAKLETAMNGAK